jgi:hypothetical protein
MDLNSLSPKTKRNLLGEMSYFCSEKFIEEDWDEYERSLEQLTLQEYEDLTEIDEMGKVIDISKIQEQAIEFLDSMNHIYKPRRKDRAIERIFVLNGLPDMTSYIKSSGEGRFEIERSPKEPVPENWLILNFIGLVEKSETYPIRKCKGESKDGKCGRYFLNLTRREKLFCTPSCASRSIQAEKRDRLRKEGEWEVYVSKMKKYQRERYKERIRAKLGRNIYVGRKRTEKED